VRQANQQPVSLGWGVVTFGVLGPLVAENAHGPVTLPGPRYRAVLARLLIARGRVVPVRTLVDDLWTDPPDGAVGALQTFVGELRRVIEPDRARRAPAKVLVTEGTGYALRPDSVDAWEFEQALGETSLSGLDGALARWRGPAYVEFADEPWARAEINRLDELRLLAVERRAEAALALGRNDEVAADLRAHTTEHPWRERGWRLLALALYRAGRQGDALAAIRAAKTALVDHLGLDPGPELRELEVDILAQRLPVNTGLVGRDPELRQLMRARRLALVEGDPGAGKTALAEAFAAVKGARTLWVRVPEYEGAVVEWPEGSYGLVVVDDLHRADEDTLNRLTDVVAQGRTLVVATFRTAELSHEFLARAARVEPTRIRLTGLAEAAVAELVRRTAHRPVTAAAIRVIHQRSGGNPFFVRELARWYDAEGALEGVPEGVRDVIRHRLDTLPSSARTVLRQAATVGRDVDLDVVIPLAGNENLVLDTLESALDLGFLVEQDRVRFAHILVRDVLYAEVSQARRTRWHADIAAILERIRPNDIDALAHHYTQAGNTTKIAQYAPAAARKAAPQAAARLWRAALATGLGDQAELELGLARALALTGDLAGARRHRARAGSPDGFDVPAIWTTNDDPELSAKLAAAIERALQSDQPLAVRARLLTSLAMELRGTRSARGSEAAVEAEAIARDLGDPALLAYALNGRFMHTFHRAGLAPERAAIGTEIVDIATEHDLVTFAVLGHLILVQAHSALADLTAADEHAAAADRLGDQHDLPLVGVFTDWYRALRLAAAGRTAEATSAYRHAAERLDNTGMWGLERGILGLAMSSLGESSVDAGPYAPWVRPGAEIPESPRDLLLETRLCLTARTAIERGDRPMMERVYSRLLPAAEELAAGSGLVTFGPVAGYLADLSDALGRPSTEYRELARKVATSARR
jgi:DNA-binding SARP family transcriptional activator